jgi:glycosyl transferase family 87
MVSPTRRRSAIDILMALFLGLAIFLMMGVTERFFSGTNDFLIFYIEGSLAGTPDLYSKEVLVKKQIELAGAVEPDNFITRFPFHAYLFKPFAMLPFRKGYLAFQIFSAACLAAFLLIQRNRYRDLGVLSAMSPAVIANFVNAQDVALVVLLCTVSLLLARRGKPWAAGATLALCAIKPHLFLMAPAAVLVHRQWKVLWGALAGALVLAAISVHDAGFDVLQKVRGNVKESHIDIMPNLRSLWIPLTGDSFPLYLVSAAAVAALVVYLVRKAPDYESAFGICLIAGPLLAHHAWINDCLLLLMAASVLVPRLESRLARNLLIFAVTPLPYFALQNGSPYSAVFPLLLIAVLAAIAAKPLFALVKNEAAVGVA